jgi:HPt (histidine-containing phosphotransfer) domain-containing protein
MTMTRLEEPVVDRAALIDRVDGDDVLLADMIEIFREQAPRQIDAVRRSIEEGDADGLRRAAHLLKGTTAEIAASRARRLAAALEDMGATVHLDEAAATIVELEREIVQVILELQALARGTSPCGL